MRLNLTRTANTYEAVVGAVKTACCVAEQLLPTQATVGGGQSGPMSPAAFKAVSSEGNAFPSAHRLIWTKRGEKLTVWVLVQHCWTRLALLGRCDVRGRERGEGGRKTQAISAKENKFESQQVLQRSATPSSLRHNPAKPAEAHLSTPGLRPLTFIDRSAVGKCYYASDRIKYIPVRHVTDVGHCCAVLLRL